MSTLSAFGIVPQTPVRTPATDRTGTTVCAECGAPIAGTLGTPSIQKPDLVDDSLAARVGETMPVYGYQCTHHVETVVLPRKCGPNAYVVPDSDGWTGVELVFSDGETRYVAVPVEVIEP